MWFPADHDKQQPAVMQAHKRVSLITAWHAITPAHIVSQARTAPCVRDKSKQQTSRRACMQASMQFGQQADEPARQLSQAQINSHLVPSGLRKKALHRPASGPLRLHLSCRSSRQQADSSSDGKGDISNQLSALCIRRLSAAWRVGVCQQPQSNTHRSAYPHTYSV
jgi:hypothetical protein